MKYYFFSALFLLLEISSAQSKDTLTWKLELEENVQNIVPLQDGKYIFLWTGEYAWLCQSADGKNLWKTRIRGYDKDAVHQLIYDSLYLVSNDDSLECHSIFQNTVLWKQRYNGIRQDRFLSLKKFDTLIVLNFKTHDLGINVNSGAELWQTPAEYNKSLIEKGTTNAPEFHRRNKYAAFLDNDDCA
ncbi:MAG: hypothetical protein PHP42_14265, partial [Bacteroidota bacterium]|nr:hypothetical protein [Bacteroidota bacterium]